MTVDELLALPHVGVIDTAALWRTPHDPILAYDALGRAWLVVRLNGHRGRVRCPADDRIGAHGIRAFAGTLR